VLRVELRESLPVAAWRKNVAPFQGHEPWLEAAHALVQVCDPGRLPHLAVVDDVDTDLGLAADDVRHCFSENPLVLGCIDALAALGRGQKIEERARTGEAADVGRENPVHQSSSPVTVRTPRRGPPGPPFFFFFNCRLR
jgi:hypothetical protein